MAAVALTAALLCAPGLHYSDGKCLTEAEWTAWPPAPVTLKILESVQVAPSTGVEQWRWMVAYYWGRHGATDRMLRIMRCESLGDPNAYNRSGASGLFQIMPFWKKAWPGNYFDPWTNAAVAYQIWLTQGYGAWVCRG